MTEEQLAFDIEGMLHEAAVEAAPEWNGAPLCFTTAYYRPAEFDEAASHWRFLHKLDKGYHPNRMWHRAIAVPMGVEVGDHTLDLFTADLRCEPWTHDQKHVGCACVGELTFMAICEPHGWHGIGGNENVAVEAWHDHSFPGWRDLPIVPTRLRDREKPGISKAAKKWIEAHYPKGMQIPGAPIITERSPMGTRHVPGRSPWGGYDIAHTAVEPNRKSPKRTIHSAGLSLESAPRVAPTGIGIGD